ncbi:histone-lysine N-methyltransferase SETDB1 [Aphelenchoides avenae]|nr:histone-lysine N-methyltransferase SETDB1 [Aphelenchus avenae]
MCVQHVFTETHDIRLPLVAFFAFDYTPAGTPLTWNYCYSEKTMKEKFGSICLCEDCIDHRKPQLKAKLHAARRIVRRSVRYYRPYPPYGQRHS